MTALNPTMRVGDQVAEAMLDPPAPAPDRRSAARRAPSSCSTRSGCPTRRRRQRLPAPALRRPAPAGRRRDRPGQRPGAAGLRRADHRPRRHGAGHGPGPHRPAASRPATPRCCSSPTTWPSSPRSASGCWSCTAAGSSRRARSPRSSPGRGTATPRGCSAASDLDVVDERGRLAHHRRLGARRRAVPRRVRVPQPLPARDRDLRAGRRRGPGPTAAHGFACHHPAGGGRRRATAAISVRRP